ncbi:upf0016 domain protein [Grosmannia clavigera kw1407]|uniref:Upf0016 domain protein n=1 Tax=Grosmannia clavigera (strain kw1407 / UAMH 11150) TaxID=655863 RepID=F0XKI2_GROCL|nr:upf0016 domain protein [Grosmannia clavigera kw1407]EFX01830.1 upf0016 domain protein [Grosmannia clavigera kw1407]
MACPPPSSRSAHSSSSGHLRRRRRQALALLVLPFLVLPTVSAAAVLPADAASAVAAAVPVAAAPVAAAPIAAAPVAAAAAAAPAVDAIDTVGGTAGTKAKQHDKVKPVDGKDGRPHEGPFVDIESSRKTGETADQAAQKSTVYIDGKKVPESNDGVMDDKNRVAPKEGTTGTSGGVSEKDKQRKAQEGQTGERVENTPDSPKEAPPMPHHEEKKINGGKDGKDEKAKDKDVAGDDASGLEKPIDLPDAPYDKAMPVPGSAKKDHLDVSKPKIASDPSKKPPRPSGGDDESATLIQPLHSFLLSLTMILVSEVGDKTFLVAALMAMKHDRTVVFSAAFSALFTMTLLSAVLGHAVPVLIPKRLTNLLAAVLFLVFGGRMLREGMGMDANEGVAAEMQEVEQELAEKEHLARENGRRNGLSSTVSSDALEMGIGGDSAGGRHARQQNRFGKPSRSASSSASPPRNRSGGVLSTALSVGNGMSNLASLLLSPAWVQTFVMTFLGEWGDRSQIATIAMAAGQDYWWVTLGAVTGHACCTGVAVIGGRAIAGRVSLKVVTMGGAVSFLIFGVIYLVESFYT